MSPSQAASPLLPRAATEPSALSLLVATSPIPHFGSFLPFLDISLVSLVFSISLVSKGLQLLIEVCALPVTDQLDRHWSTQIEAHTTSVRPINEIHVSLYSGLGLCRLRQHVRTKWPQPICSRKKGNEKSSMSRTPESMPQKYRAESHTVDSGRRNAAA